MDFAPTIAQAKKAEELKKRIAFLKMAN